MYLRENQQIRSIDFVLSYEKGGNKYDFFVSDRSSSAFGPWTEGYPFGALKEKKELVKMIPLAVVSAAAGILCWILPKKGQFVEKIGLSMVIGGGLSNLYDRLFRGYVVDYFSIQWKKLKDVVFNLGDIFVFAGSLILLLRELFCKK